MRMAVKKSKILLAMIFALILFAGSVSSVLVLEQDFSDRENRKLAEKPEFSVKKFLRGKYQKQYEEWLSDRFVCRDGWSVLAANMQAVMGKKDINGVYLGKDGYLLEKYQESEFDRVQIQENVESLSGFLNDAVEQYGKEHVYCMMISSKTEALPNRLPGYAGFTDTGEVLEALKNSLGHPDHLLYAGDFLEEHKDEYIYYRTDHHWTTLGAYYAWKEWAEKMGLPRREMKDFQRETIFKDFYGTTYNKAQIHVEPDSVELFHCLAEDRVHVEMDDGEQEADTLYFPQEAKKGFNRYDVFLGGNTFKIVITTKSHTGRTLLLFKDSFANCFVPFLIEDYDQIIMIDYRYGKITAGSIMGQYPDITDVLVLFNTEKFMQNTKLGRMADTDGGKSEMKEFNPDDFIE